MRRRLKRRANKKIDAQDAPWGDERTHGKLVQDDDDDKELSVSSPPRLRRDKDSINNISSTREFTFNLEEAGGSPVIDTDDFGGGTISTVTNDQAFRDNVFRCGFDSTEYGVMKQQQQQSPSLTKRDEEEINKGSAKKTQASPMGVNELDFPDQQFEWADFDSNNMGSKSKQGLSSTTLNLSRNPKKDDDSFFYSASATPSEFTNDTKLVGETITLGSTSSYLHSFDILGNGRKAETQQGARLDIHQMGMGSRSSPVRQPIPFDSSQTHQTKEVHTAAAGVAAPPPPPPPQAPRQRSLYPKEKVPNKDDSTKPGSGCAMPEIVQEFVDDVKSVLSQVITVAYLACSEGEQCLSRCQGDDSGPQPSQLNTIVEDSTAPVKPNSPPDVREEEPKRFNKPWAGDYLCRRTGTEETADNSSEDAEGTTKKTQGSRTNRLKKLLTSFKTRR